MGSQEARVTRLQPRVQPFENAVEFYFNGQFAMCLGVLEHHASADAFALGARTLIRMNRPADALEAVRFAFATLDTDDALSRSHRGELLMLCASALLRTEPHSEATHDAFVAAQIAVYCAANSALEAEFTFLQAYASLLDGDLDAVREDCQRTLEVRGGIGDQPHLIPLAHSRARAADALAFVAARAEAYAQQRRYAKLALEEADRGPVHDAVFEANLLQNVSLFVQDFGDDDGFVRSRFDAMSWTDSLASQRYEILRALGWASALAGNSLAAFRDLRDAAESAPTISRKIRATLDRAYFSRELRQTFSACEEADYAERLASRIDWNAVAHDEGDLAALLQLAENLAPIAADRARRYFERYRGLKAKLPADLLAHRDRRPYAEELTADAAISRAEGNPDRARVLLADAFKIWDELGYGVRAALVARELSALGAGPQYAAYAVAEAARRPRSWFAGALLSAEVLA